MTIEGTSNCNTGKIILRIYEGEGENANFLGTASAYIEGHSFTAIATNIREIASGMISFRYSVD